jgi:hypothetical protein
MGVSPKRTMHALDQRPLEITNEEWAFRLRWSAQDVLSHSSSPFDEKRALVWLYRSLELGDVNAAWELAVVLESPGGQNVGLAERLKYWAAAHGAVDAMSWRRDEFARDSIEWRAWDARIEHALLPPHTTKLTPPSSDLCEAIAAALGAR